MIPSAYKQALEDVHEYGIMMGWVHEGTDTCDMFVTLTNMAQLDDDGCLEEKVRPSFVTVWNGFSKLLAIADNTEV